MKLYRKKPVVVKAIQWDGTFEQSFEVVEFGEGSIIRQSDIDNKRQYLAVKTLEGTMLISPRDYIIKGVKGEFYPCKPDIFEMTYEEVQDETID